MVIVEKWLLNMKWTLFFSSDLNCIRFHRKLAQRALEFGLPERWKPFLRFIVCWHPRIAVGIGLHYAVLKWPSSSALTSMYYLCRWDACKMSLLRVIYSYVTTETVWEKFRIVTKNSYDLQNNDFFCSETEDWWFLTEKFFLESKYLLTIFPTAFVNIFIIISIRRRRRRLQTQTFWAETD